MTPSSQRSSSMRCDRKDEDRSTKPSCSILTREADSLICLLEVGEMTIFRTGVVGVVGWAGDLSPRLFASSRVRGLFIFTCEL